MPDPGGQPLLTLIIPTYQEAHRIADTLREVAAYLARQPYASEIVVADDGSRDGSFDAACAVAGELPVPLRARRAVPNRGKGAALKLGFAASRGEHVAFTDADLATPIDALEAALAAIGEADVVIGSRKLRGAEVVVAQPWIRQTLGKGFTWLVRTLVTEVSDVTCGFKLFRGDAGRALFASGRLHDWSFDAEILFLARQRGLRVREIPVRWSDRDGTKVRLPSAILGSLLGILRIRTNALAGRYAAPADAIEAVARFPSDDLD